MQVPSEIVLCIFGTLVAVFLRCCTSLHPYSGQNKPPMYGDYEAQRHWMEITTNLKINQWYHNTTENDLLYWGLDYPPLTAYHMYLCGQIARIIDPNYVKLGYSRGFESDSHKIFMRYSVLVTDVLLYIPAVICYFAFARNNGTVCKVRKHKGATPKESANNRNRPGVDCLERSLTVILSLLYPGVVLIDHGHFQYNTVSLAFLIYATLFLLNERNLLASFFFCLALNYKQMELYHALPFFFYLLSTCVPKPGYTMYSGCVKLAKIALVVVLTFGLIWAPFLVDVDGAFQVLKRLFPVDRGVFEDKVANIWCSLNVVFKFKTLFCNEKMVKLCMFATLAALFPSAFDLFVRPSLKKFIPALINSSLAFFLFSFQVHEKSILLVAIPVMLYLPKDPFVCFWLLVISTFSMLPLFVKDDLVIAYFALMIFYVNSFYVCLDHTFASQKSASGGFGEFYKKLLTTLTDVEYKKLDLIDILVQNIRHFVKNLDSVKILVVHVLMVVSFLGSLTLTIAFLVFKPPAAYPDLFPLLISAYCCVHFVGFFVYFNVVQLSIPQEFDYAKVKIK